MQNCNKVLKQIIQVDSQLAKTSWSVNLNRRCRAYWCDLSNKHETATSGGVAEITRMWGGNSERRLHQLTFSFAPYMLQEVF